MPDWRLSQRLNEKKRKRRMTAKVWEDIKPKAKQSQGVAQARSKGHPRRKQVKYGDLVACTTRVKEPRWWKGSPEDNSSLAFLSVANKAGAF